MVLLLKFFSDGKSDMCDKQDDEGDDEIGMDLKGCGF